MKTVYVPQLPSRLDRESGVWVPTVNLSPAEKYGEIFVMLPPEANRLHTAPLVAALQEKMQSFDQDDYIVAVGDPTLLAVAATIAAKKTGGLLRMLKWDRLSTSYIPVEVQL